MTPEDLREPSGANPQLEDGFFPIANETAEAFSRLQLSGYQWRLLWVIFRQTYGWKRKTDRISITYFEKKTGLDRRHIFRALSEMVDRKIVAKNDTTFVTTYGFQKDYTKWKLLPKMSRVTKMATEPLPKKAPIKERKTKDISVVHHSGEMVSLEEGVKEILSLFNEKRAELVGGNGLKPITQDKQIKARLTDTEKDRASVVECCRVILTKSEDPYFRENPKYFHPETLFRKSNFRKYADEAEIIRAKRSREGTP